jgi:hypothetical protein
MTEISIAVLSAAEFEIARGLISGLSGHASYDDWLDCRYGRFMGLSLGGADGDIVTVSLAQFLEWCFDRKLRPSESALDAFALHSACQCSETGSAAETSLKRGSKVPPPTRFRGVRSGSRLGSAS